MTKVYMADVDFLQEEALFRRLCDSAPAERRRKIDSLRFPKDKRLSLGAWLLLEQALREWGLREEPIVLSRNEYGKPCLKDYPELHFNLSHSGSRVLCAVSTGEVGCDIQRMGKMDPKLAERFFSPEEVAALNALKETEARRLFFYRLWALKESFVKAVGLGLSLPLRDFSIGVEETDIRVAQSRFPDRQFYFREFAAEGEYVCACCAGDADFSGLNMVKLA